MNLGSSHQSCMWPCAESSSKAGEKNKTDIQRQMGMCVGRGGWEREGGREIMLSTLMGLLFLRSNHGLVLNLSGR